MATLRCIDCHVLFNPATLDTPVDNDHRWCFVHAFKANKVESVPDYYALCLKHFQDMPPRKVVRKTIKVKAEAARMTAQQLWANRAAKK